MAKIKDEDIDALRERADILEVVSGHSRLKKAGAHTYKGLCPFHPEKTPSFTVDAAKGLWHCFGCGEGGNVFQFIQKIEDFPFPEAVEWLAHKTGFQLRYEDMRPGAERTSGVKARLLAANGEAARFYHRSLLSASEASTARRYLKGRGFDKEVAERWCLGFAPGRDELCRHLSGKGFSHGEIEQADLGRRSERDGSLYDTFRSRIIFPTWNLQGDVAGFGARALADQQPKYLNTSETPVFSKSRLLYGLNRAKSAISRNMAVVVEGYTDVIALHEAGVEEAIATNGVALGEAHFEQLKKFTQRVVLMLDADEAGRRATERSFSIQHRIGLEVLVAPLPPGRDPAEVASEDGPEAVRKVIESARPLLEFKLEQTIANLSVDTPEARAHTVREAAKVLGLQPDPIARHEYAFSAAAQIGVDVELLHRALSEQGTVTSEPERGGSGRAEDRRLPGHVKVEREALHLLLTRAEMAPRARQINETYFTSPARRELYRAALRAHETQDGLSPSEIAESLSVDARALFTELTLTDAESGQDQTEEVFGRLGIFKMEREIKSRRDVLQDLNPTVDPQRHDALFTELVGLEAKRRDLLSQLQGRSR